MAELASLKSVKLCISIPLKVSSFRITSTLSPILLPFLHNSALVAQKRPVSSLTI